MTDDLIDIVEVVRGLTLPGLVEELDPEDQDYVSYLSAALSRCKRNTTTFEKGLREWIDQTAKRMDKGMSSWGIEGTLVEQRVHEGMRGGRFRYDISGLPAADQARATEIFYQRIFQDSQALAEASHIVRMHERRGEGYVQAAQGLVTVRPLYPNHMPEAGKDIAYIATADRVVCVSTGTAGELSRGELYEVRDVTPEELMENGFAKALTKEIGSTLGKAEFGVILVESPVDALEIGHQMDAGVYKLAERMRLRVESDYNELNPAQRIGQAFGNLFGYKPNGPKGKA